ncbi:hypothetical protein FFLO_07148 [Filobasidium floriforme]|uniref:Uncharacterized protein n=1 Tax=Filobasidium floriforme TaxID=5210 RepID=A0A8K0JEW3_9TREE|nr:uncharacterized protein HD553DRAFT_322436 [Filobasidium floriforme]KAG7527223.1 hypothetical protein FFLO_07148 [Filobasidium floriforme]KAH8088598.1 hypothetical protein HD553DRAFT_322436 [Filobasidium floriforme]
MPIFNNISNSSENFRMQICFLVLLCLPKYRVSQENTVSLAVLYSPPILRLAAILAEWNMSVMRFIMAAPRPNHLSLGSFHEYGYSLHSDSDAFLQSYNSQIQSSHKHCKLIVKADQTDRSCNILTTAHSNCPRDKQAVKEEMEWHHTRWRFRTELIGKLLTARTYHDIVKVQQAQLLHLLIGELAYNQGLRTPHTPSLPSNTVDYLLRLPVHPCVTSPDHPVLQIDFQDGMPKSFHHYMRCKQVNNLKDRLEGFLEMHTDGPGSIKRHRQWSTANSLSDPPTLRF